MIITQTPFRISFFGGGTDYPAWYEKHGGCVLSTTIDKYCYLNVRYLPPFFGHKHRVVWTDVERVRSLTEIRHPAVRAALEFTGIGDRRGVEITHSADLPARSGLGSSSAFAVGLLHALETLCSGRRQQWEIARKAIILEQDVIGECVGIQDQIACAMGGFNRIGIDHDGSWHIDAMHLPHGRLTKLHQRLMLFYTGTARFASEIAAQQVDAITTQAITLERVAEMVDEAVGFLRNDRLDDFGRMLDESWQLKRKLPGASTEHIDHIYAAAMREGALGGKVLGVGGGGFMLFYVPPEQQMAVARALWELVEVPFKFESGGSRVIFGGQEC